MRSGNPWVHHSQAGLFQSATAPGKARTNVTAILRKHLVAGLAGFGPAPDQLEWWKPVGDRLVLALSVERLSGMGVGRMLTMELIVREAGSEAVIARYAVEKWFGAPHGSCLTYVDGTDLGATLERIVPALSRGIEQLVVELSGTAATAT